MQIRFEIFKDNLKFIDQHNKKNTGYWLGLNDFADLSQQEFTGTFLGTNIDPSLRRRRRLSKPGFKYAGVKEVPQSVDWRQKGAVTHVKNQGNCGMVLSRWILSSQEESNLGFLDFWRLAL